MAELWCVGEDLAMRLALSLLLLSACGGGGQSREEPRKIVAVIGSASAACGVSAGDVSKEFGRLVDGMKK